MQDVVLDSCLLGDFLTQYFSAEAANRGYGRFRAEGRLSGSLARRLNGIVDSSRYRLSALVVTSAFAFVELARKWEDMVGDRFTELQLDAFIRQPPEWFDIAPVDEDLLPFFLEVPSRVDVHGDSRPIEWSDAIHAAVVLSREADCLLATTDVRLEHIPAFQGRLAL